MDDHYKWVALSNTTLGIFMATLDSSIVIISLPAIFRGIKLDPLVPANIGYLLWMLMGYLVESWSSEDETRALLLAELVELSDVATNGGDDERIVALDAELRHALGPGAASVVLAAARGRLVLPADRAQHPLQVGSQERD